jgi:hypothetical protein
MGEHDEKLYPEPIPGRIVVVGVCAAGKSVLVRRLQVCGFNARSCAQEHSYVPDMWRRLSRPQVLVYLDASALTLRRRGRAYMDEAYLAKQHHRLRHAREHCQIYVDTDPLDEEQVCIHVKTRLTGFGIVPERRSSR